MFQFLSYCEGEHMSMKILIADDNKLIRTILERLLADFGELTTVKNGEDAVAECRKSLEAGGTPFSLICMDMSMGVGMTGDMAVAEIRSLELEAALAGRPHTARVLMVTAFADRESVMKTKDTCDGYILKPIVKETFYAKLESFGFRPMPAEPPAAPEPEDPTLIKPSPDAGEIASKANLSAWDSAPFLALREERIVALIPGKPRQEGEPPTFTTAPLEKAKFLMSVKPFALAARVENEHLSIQCGANMAYLPVEKAFVARRGGFVFLKDGLLDINPLLEIEGDLRYRDIDFAGSLLVKGDISDDVSISADEGIKVEGDVGSSSLRSQGDISLRRINGQGRSSISSGGNVSLEYAYDCVIKAIGEISIAHESVNCELKSMRSIKCGALLGKNCSAFMSAELQKAGSPKAMRTVIRAGISYLDEERLDSLRVKLAEIDSEIVRLEQMLGPYATECFKALSMPERQRDRILELAGRRVMLKYDARPDAEQALAEAQESLGRFPAAKICVSEMLYKGTELEIGEKRESFPQDCFGPITITTISDDSRYYIER